MTYENKLPIEWLQDYLNDSPDASDNILGKLLREYPEEEVDSSEVEIDKIVDFIKDRFENEVMGRGYMEGIVSQLQQHYDEVEQEKKEKGEVSVKVG